MRTPLLPITTATLASSLALLALPALAQASIEYDLFGHHVSTGGATLSPFKHGAFALAPLPQSDGVSLVVPGGHALTSVKYDTTTGTTGWKADALALPGAGVFESEATLSYHDALLLGIAAGGAVPAGPVTATITIDGTFSGATSEGSTGFELNAFGLFTGAYLQRKPDKAHPGMDTVSVLHDAVTTTFSVAAGAPFPFSQTLSLSAPLAALGVWAPPPLHVVTFGNGGPAGCTAANPCGVKVPLWPGPVFAAPVVIEFDVVDTLVKAGSGAGAPGESVIDQTNTARLSVQMPAGVYFSLSSGALPDDPAAMQRFLDPPAVPEPSQWLLFLAGLAVLPGLARRRRGTAARAGRSGRGEGRGGGRGGSGGSASSAQPGLVAAVAIASALWPIAGSAQGVTFMASALVGACGGNGANAYTLHDPGSHAAAADGGTVFDLADGITPLADCSAQASANGDTGTLHTLARANNTRYGAAVGEADTGFRDVLTFAVPPGHPNGPTPVTLRMVVKGRFQGVDSTFHNNTSLWWGEEDLVNPGMIVMTVPVAHAGFDWGGPSGPFGSRLAHYSAGGLTGGSNLSLDPDQLQITMLLAFTALPGHSYVIGASQQTSVAAGLDGHGIADFSHTASLAIDLPPGYSFTSASGVFLSAVPELPPAALLLAGLAGMAGLGTRPRRGVRKPRPMPPT